MYYYRHGEVIFASLLPDLPLEPAKRPSAGTPSLFLIDLSLIHISEPTRH